MSKKVNQVNNNKLFGIWAESDLLMPERKNPTDTGWDLRAKERTWVPAGRPVIIKTGVHLNMPSGWWAWISDRSSSFLELELLIHQGWVDETYNKEVGIIARSLAKKQVNEELSEHGQWIEAGERIAQLTFIQRPETQNWMTTKLDQMPESDRGGFGSTGKN